MEFDMLPVDSPSKRTRSIRFHARIAIVLAIWICTPLTVRAEPSPNAQPDPTPQIEQADNPPNATAGGQNAESVTQKPQSWSKLISAIDDWGGVRPWLGERGITLDLQYSADFLHNTYGGLDTTDAQVFRGLFNLSLTLDTEAMDLWDGGTFFINFQQIHGRDISEEYVGDIQALNNNDAPDRTQVAEYWYEQSFFDGKLRTKLGKMDANADFAYVDYGLEFINSSAGLVPNIPMPTYPDGALGAAVFIEPTDWFYAGAGVYDGQGVGSRWGFETAFHETDTSFTIFELGVRPVFEIAGRRLPGTYRAGGWYHSGSYEIIEQPRERQAPGAHLGNAGLYLGFDQLLFPENPDVEDDEQGLGAFFQFGYAPSAYNEITQYYGGGLQYTGLIPARDADVIGLGLFHASLSGRLQSLEQRFSETAVELFYGFPLTPFFSLKPDLQYIVNPAGDGRDALVAGVRMEVLFEDR